MLAILRTNTPINKLLIPSTLFAFQLLQDGSQGVGADPAGATWFHFSFTEQEEVI